MIRGEDINGFNKDDLVSLIVDTFNEMETVSDIQFKVYKELRDKVKLKYQALIHYEDTTKYDYIFCKNVMIYFTKVSRHKALTNIINNSMGIGSKLFLGMSESANDRRLKRIKINDVTYYEKVYA